jgi:uncharacterized membrane protein YphA (DoxX/SURF4 family)
MALFLVPTAAAGALDRRVSSFRFVGMLAIPLVALAGRPTAAHEAWLLTPTEVADLAETPLPAIFTSPAVLAGAAGAAGLVALLALAAEDRLRPAETRLAAPLAEMAPEIGSLILRLSLAAMLAMSALGGLPRHGTAPWSEPTLFVPDMQLVLAPGWSWLQGAQIALACFLAAGFLTRVAGLGLAILGLLGVVAFGVPFLDYGPHFVAPAIMLAVFGGGALSVDRATGMIDWLAPSPRLAQIGWTVAIALLGAGFVYLAVVYKLTQPTLLMAILEHGALPIFGIPLAVVALLMTLVELVAGLLLALGRLVRPIALFLIGAFTFFAVALGEPPMFHANLYGAMAFLVLSGRALPALPRLPEFGRADQRLGG